MAGLRSLLAGNAQKIILFMVFCILWNELHELHVAIANHASQARNIDGASRVPLPAQPRAKHEVPASHVEGNTAAVGRSVNAPYTRVAATPKNASQAKEFEEKRGMKELNKIQPKAHTAQVVVKESSEDQLPDESHIPGDVSVLSSKGFAVPLPEWVLLPDSQVTIVDFLPGEGELPRQQVILSLSSYVLKTGSSRL